MNIGFATSNNPTIIGKLTYATSLKNFKCMRNNSLLSSIFENIGKTIFVKIDEVLSIERSRVDFALVKYPNIEDENIFPINKESKFLNIFSKIYDINILDPKRNNFLKEIQLKGARGFHLVK